MKKLNLIGKKFGKLIVLEEVPKRTGSSQRRYRCFCEACGNSEYYIDTGELTRKRAKIKTCGCRIGIYENIANNRYGQLVAIKELNSHKWLCKCDCGNICEVIRGNLISGNTQSCGCIKSKGEKYIAIILNNNSINFIQQYSFKDLLGKDNKHPLLFDFAIFNDENKLLKLIEFDGKQHFDEKNNFYNKELELNRKRKIEYCNKNNIKLQIIPYYKFKDIDIKYLCSDLFFTDFTDLRKTSELFEDQKVENVIDKCSHFTKDELFLKVYETNWEVAARHFKISSNSLRYWWKKFNLPKEKSEKDIYYKKITEPI